MTDDFPAMLRPAEVSRITGLSSTSLWRYRKAGKFPKAVKLGEKAIGWPASEIIAWVKARVAERDAA